MDIAGLELEEMDLAPGQLEEPLRRCCVEHQSLFESDLAVGTAHVVAEDPSLEYRGRRALTCDSDRLHLAPRLTFSLSGMPVAFRWTASTSARTASAISGAD